MNKQIRLKTKLSEATMSRYKNVPAPSKENDDSKANQSLDKHASYGKIPGYLIKMRENKQSEHAQEEEERRLASIPEGCREMTEDERQATVEEARQKRSEILDAIKRLPLRIETLGQRKRKIQLEHDLTEIERTLDKLSHKTVLIRV